MQLKTSLLFLLQVPLALYCQQFVSSSFGAIKELLFTGHPECRCAMLDLIVALDSTHQDTVVIYYEYQEARREILEEKACQNLLLRSYLDNNKFILIPSDIRLIEKYLKRNENEKALKKFTHDQVSKINELSEEAFIGEASKFSSVKLKKIYSGNNGFIKWVQDIVIITSKDDTLELLFNKEIAKEDGIDLIDNFSTQTKLNSLEIDLKEKGGNIQFADSIVFIGKDVLMKNEKMIIEGLFDENNLIYIGTKEQTTNIEDSLSFQPAFHIDLFMNSLQLSKDSLLFIFSYFFEPTNRFEKDWNVKIEEIKSNLENDLSNVQYKVLFDSIPIFLDNKALYSFSNAIYEVNGENRIAYLPSYKVVPEELHDLVQKRLKKYNFKVFFIDKRKIDLDEITKKRGSLHCISKVLIRSNY